MWRLLRPLPPLNTAGAREVQGTSSAKEGSLDLVLQDVLKGDDKGLFGGETQMGRKREGMGRGSHVETEAATEQVS